MCEYQVTNVRKLRHNKEIALFLFTSTVTVLTVLTLFTASFFQSQIYDFVREVAIENYRADNPEAIELTDEKVIELLDESTRETLNYIDEYGTASVILLIVGMALLLMFYMGSSYGRARASYVLVRDDQFPELHAIWSTLSKQMGLKKTPELYLANGNGVLNAYATCLPGYRPYGVVYSDMVEKGLESGDMTTVRFILGHELGHIRLGHVYLWYNMLTVVGNLPGLKYLLGLPLSRAREYSCDRVGYSLSADKDCRALIMLAAGKHHFDQVNTEAYLRDHGAIGGFWQSVYNFFNGHPNINWRIQSLLNNRSGELFYKRRGR